MLSFGLDLVIGWLHNWGVLWNDHFWILDDILGFFFRSFPPIGNQTVSLHITVHHGRRGHELLTFQWGAISQRLKRVTNCWQTQEFKSNRCLFTPTGVIHLCYKYITLPPSHLFRAGAQLIQRRELSTEFLPIRTFYLLSWDWPMCSNSWIFAINKRNPAPFFLLCWGRLSADWDAVVVQVSGGKEEERGGGVIQSGHRPSISCLVTCHT